MLAKRGSRDLIWIAIGGLGLLIVFFTMLYLQGDRDPATQIAFKAKRLELVSSMRLSLAAASEAQNTLVMSAGEMGEKSFADEARSATAALKRGQIELETLLKEHGNSREAELMIRFAQTLAEFQQVDKKLLELAVQNSNRKAYGLAYGPAMKLLKDMDEALSSIGVGDVESPSKTTIRQVQLTDEVRIGILRIQVMLFPHIAEPSDEKMDQFELQLSAEDRRVHENLAALSALLAGSDMSNLDKAKSLYAEFEKLRSQIIKLSRQNTDVRAVEIVLREKRKAMLACQDALVSLEQAIQAEPITTTIPSGRSP